MHSTRVATFLLGAWMACSVLLDVFAFANPRLTNHLLTAPPPPAAAIIKPLSQADVGLFLRHIAREQYRFYLSGWGTAQVPLGLLFIGFLFFAVDQKVFPLALGSALLALVLFQDLAVTPELIYRGREIDFPPGSLTSDALARVRALSGIFAGAEAAKLALGAVLASYIFVHKSRKRVRPAEAPEDLGRRADLRRA